METFANDHAPRPRSASASPGVDRPHDEAVIRGSCAGSGYRENARVVNDAVIALTAGAPERFGIVVLAGTGSIAYGADRSRAHRALGRLRLAARRRGIGLLARPPGAARGRARVRRPRRRRRGCGRSLFEALEADVDGGRGAARVRARRCRSTASPRWRRSSSRRSAAGDAVAAELIRRGGAGAGAGRGAVARQLDAAAASPFRSCWRAAPSRRARRWSDAAGARPGLPRRPVPRR